MMLARELAQLSECCISRQVEGSEPSIAILHVLPDFVAQYSDRIFPYGRPDYLIGRFIFETDRYVQLVSPVGRRRQPTVTPYVQPARIVGPCLQRSRGRSVGLD